MKQHTKLLLGFIFGVALGLIGFYYFPAKEMVFMGRVTEVFTFVGAIFLRMIFMVTIPLILAALMLGTMELSQGTGGFGKVGSRCLIFTVVLSGIAACIALFTTNTLKPGAGLVFDKAALAANSGVLTIAKNATAAKDKPWFQYLVDLLPQNPIDSAARAFQGEIIAMMVFALFFGWALSTVIKEENHPMTKVLDAIFQACMKIIAVAIQLAPVAIFCIVFNTAYRMGAGFLGNVAYFAFVVVLGLLIQFFVVYSIVLITIGKTNPFAFYKQCREVYVYAFSTASSNATLPVALKCATDVLKIPPRIARFVITIGASANQNGSGLYEGVVVLFMAQVFSVDLTVGQQVQVVLMSMLAGVGTAGIPGGSLPLIVVLMVNVGVPAEGIGLILGVDRFLDMCRTTLNVAGDLVIAKLITESVGQEAIDQLHAS
ncbi:dicarboxylate/amino acid:cation symporter [Propionivibrio dicarboxylicus]|uniref:Na+/H+-dicarboxylate symporter n=1 Tax=Propionivibrio dicarboxylicus TaxID=83767 RepID=A0A1G7Y9C8_9RHOO|nr:dicarboxylate/amino acid:cation symporter [Propionivibrio dicarboxylicus]SDG92916.1 Na+/H+-dicarboxylate symporter [Propionivibrio dicarboxylicus]